MQLQNKHESQNKGLPTRFELDSNGGFKLRGGREKVDNNVMMFLDFISWYRLFTQDYCLGYHANIYVQNTSSYLFQFKNILRIRVLGITEKYLPFAKIQAVDIPINFSNRRETTLYIQFKYNLDNVDEYQIIKKILL